MKCTPMLHTTRHGFLCVACSKRIDASMEHCKFHSFGCDYANDDQWIRRKHEEWMCEFNDKDCWKCRMKYLHTRQIDHWSQNHCKLLTPTVNNDVATVSYSGKLWIALLWSYEVTQINWRDCPLDWIQTLNVMLWTTSTNFFCLFQGLSMESVILPSMLMVNFSISNLRLRLIIFPFG